jgi:predicted nucleotide-binding protein
MLRWPRSRTSLELAQQLNEGEGIRGLLSAPDGIHKYDELARLSQRWHERNRTILDQAFIPSLVHEYDPPRTPRISSIYDGPPTLQEKFDKTLERLGGRVERLGSIRDRLDLFDEQESGASADRVASSSDAGQTVFLVHGRDSGSKHEVARAIEQLTGRTPVILHEQLDRGRTVIEKFETHASDAGAAVVLLTSDDEGRVKSGEPQAEFAGRARQNVVYELGWFHGRLGRGKVIALLSDIVEKPSDLDGVLYLPLDSSGTWKLRLGQELRAAGVDADLNNVAL